ncbi:MAG: hypothetical protein OXT06_04770 [Rhodospirillaceae bacterium]|nr:hypothetical protein [Rhodospirillaceae bacterium]MDD9917879.1 hypothetical protein [Rhodospirillaceae bacterium]MDD9930210.1 hypothetical protein [Rhodospirillaceae bacterium]
MIVTRPVVILGGASGVIVAEALYDLSQAGCGVECGGYLNDALPTGTSIGDQKVLGPFEAWSDLPAETLFISVLHKAKEMPQRMDRIERLGIPDSRWAIVRHPAATVARDTQIGPGSYIGPNAVVMPGTVIGRHVALRPGCSVSHDNALGDFVFAGPNVTLNGNCRVGAGAHIAPNAAIREETEIGELSVVGMGSIVLNDVPARSMVAGNPARVIGRYDGAGMWGPIDG